MTRKTTIYARKRAQGHTPQRSDGITIARMHNTRLTPPEVERIMGLCRTALAALRQAQGTYTQWVVLCTACHVAMAIEDGGIITGQRDIISDAEQALDAIGARCGLTAAAWTPRPCTGPELTALADLVPAHSRQVRELTYGEYTRQCDLAVARVATDGGQVFKAETCIP
jgi:hypothetical protein